MESKRCEEKQEDEARNQRLLCTVKTYFYEDDQFNSELQRFFKTAADVVDLKQEENKLEYTKLHSEYMNMFERRITACIERQHGTVLSFYTILREMLLDGDQSENHAFAQMFIAGKVPLSNMIDSEISLPSFSR
jgi:hypothetical protein